LPYDDCLPVAEFAVRRLRTGIVVLCNIKIGLIDILITAFSSMRDNLEKKLQNSSEATKNFYRSSAIWQ